MRGWVEALGWLTWSVAIGTLPRGRTNSVLDVPGVGLGHATVISDDAEPPAGSGIARTGVTVLDPGGDVGLPRCLPGWRCSTAQAS